MSQYQHSLVIENDSGSAVRNDLNDALEALAMHQSGATEPTIMYANMFWYDTNNHQLKIRNEANTAWFVFADCDQTDNRVVPTTGAGRHRNRWVNNVVQAIPNPSATTMLFDTQITTVTGGSWVYSLGEIAPPEIGVYQILFQGTFEATTGSLGAVTVTLEYYDGTNWASLDGGLSIEPSSLNQKMSFSLTNIVDVSDVNHAVRLRHICNDTGTHQWLASQQHLSIIRLD